MRPNCLRDPPVAATTDVKAPVKINCIQLVAWCLGSRRPACHAWCKSTVMDSMVGDCVGIIKMHFQLKLHAIYSDNLSKSYVWQWFDSWNFVWQFCLFCFVRATSVPFSHDPLVAQTRHYAPHVLFYCIFTFEALILHLRPAPSLLNSLLMMTDSSHRRCVGSSLLIAHSPVKRFVLPKHGTKDAKTCTECVKYIHLP